ncbi:mediator of RNA polymerase II transcription subunit 14 [Culicoides brevitarsis]|uniref:mediator of RNA polymerase II transcription subunit 14 n=1 Tax=Culicoides brevitarsis TaxID=469753 RepID=UPI00307B1BA8
MAPTPLEGAVVNYTGPTNGQDGSRQGSISLGVLIDFIVQRTYHDLTVLAELLPRKTDLERKIEIYNFSARTRQLFIRLLALVKWANSASKVDKCSHIMSFLDKQSMLFIETADMLARMAREILVNARLPNFHIPAAIEVLTTGTYNKLPACIKEKIVPADPITASEEKVTLNRLDQVIQHRLVTGNLIPQMRKFKVENGRVTFTVDHEFRVSLTVMGDGPNIPWRLLDIDILVEDRQTGDGKPLVHVLQVNYIHQLVQARLIDNQNALTEVYKVLHYFCQSLQLEVMYTQTLRLCRDRLDDHIHVDDYVPGNKITVSYWRELSNRDPRSEVGYKLTVQADPIDGAKPLAVYHVPSIGGTKESEVADRAVRSDMLSMERLLVHTVYIRSLARLNDLKAEFQMFMKDTEFLLQGTPAILTIPVLTPCLRAEQVHITVDTHSGRLHCHVPKHMDCPFMAEMETALNNDTSKLPALISELRYWITKRRCEKTLQHLPATLHEKLPLIYAADSPLTKIGKNKAYLELHRHQNVILIVELQEKTENPSEMDYTFYLVSIVRSTGNEISDKPANTPENPEAEMPKMFMKVMTLIEFDTFAATHGPGTSVEVTNNQKRKSSAMDFGPPPKQTKRYPAYFIPELAHVVAMCDEKLPFVQMGQELSNRGIPHCGLQVEANATSSVMKILSLPQPLAPVVTAGSETKTMPVPVIDKTIWDSIRKRLLSVSVRTIVNKNYPTRSWMFELIFFGSPIQSTSHKEQGKRRSVVLQHDMSAANSVGDTVDAFLSDWARIVYLYSLVSDFNELYSSDKYNLRNIVTVKSYNYTTLCLAYGPNKEIKLNIWWCTRSKEFKTMFHGDSAAINSHSIMRDQLQAHLNHNYNLAQLVHTLHETYQPLTSIAKLQILPHLGITAVNPKIAVLSFCIIAQSPTMIRISYQETYCLEIRFRGSGLVSIRDGAYSRFAGSNVVGEWLVIGGLKGFLSKYVDENAVYRRRSQSEDDNPPSPTLEEVQGGPHSVGSSFLTSGLRGPQSPRDPNVRFTAPMTPPSGSNPHTPASPMSQQHAMTGQQHPNFNLTSPPSAPHLAHPSPGNIMPASPLNPQPSPLAAHSPGPNTLSYMQGHTDSPFAALSPAAWPGSPGMPRPSPRAGQSPDHRSQITISTHMSRVLPSTRTYAGSVPTLLTHEALDQLCRASPHPQKEISNIEMSPIERFLGCVYMRRQLQRLINSEDFLTPITSNEPGKIMFKADCLQCQVYLNPNHMQSLHMKVTQVPSPDGSQRFPWSPDDLQVLEQFFDTRVAAPPYRYNELSGFMRMFSVPPHVLKDFIQIMRCELMPELTQGCRWNVSFCLRVPPAAAPIVPIGTPGVIIRIKILFFLQLTRVPYMQGQDWKNTPTLILPMLYDVQTNLTQLVERREGPMSMPMQAVSMKLRSFATEFQQQQMAGQNECSIFPAIRDLMMNLMPQNDQPPPQNPMQSPMQVNPMAQQVMAASSPNPNIMHQSSPMAAPHTPQGQPHTPGQQ